MEQMHSLLNRQLKRYYGREGAIAKERQGFIEAVNNAYCQSDTDRSMLERSLELSSQELLQANSELRAIFQALPDLFLLLDNEGTILDLKGGTTTDLYIPLEKFLGKRIHDVPLDKVGNKFLEAIHQARETKSIVTVEYSIGIQDQENFYEARLLPLPKNHIIAIVRNITERTRAEHEVQNLQRYNRGLIESSLDPLVTFDQKGIILDVNEATIRATGRTREELIGTPFADYFTHPEKAYRGAMLVFEAGGVRDYELVMKARDGTEVIVAYNASVYRDQTGQVVGAFAAARDITSLKCAEAELRRERDRVKESIQKKISLLSERAKLIAKLEKANIQLRELDRLKTAFLANMSHELRTPMNAIIGYTDLLVDGIDGPVNEEQEKSLKKIAANSRYLLQLINDLLDISKIESGKIKLETKEFDLKWLIESVIPTFEPLLKEKDLTVTDNIDEGVPLVYGDEDAIKQILINLLSNAVKCTYKGGITITARPSERGIEPGEPPIFAEVCVEDSGIGIKEEDLGTIFDKFVQVDLSTVRQYEGTGLGLSIARGLVALHKGMMWATSKYGEGSKFYFTIPLGKEILEKPGEPVIEPRVAEGLADYFGKPVETFLKEPHYAGKPIRCWEYVRCGHPSCPAYGIKETRCWLILGTHCAEMKIAAYPEKVDFCKGCEVIEGLVLKAAEEEYKPVEAESPKRKEAAKKTVLAIDDNPEDIDIIRKYLGEEYRVVGLLSGEKAVEKAKEVNPLAITLDILMPKKDGWEVLRELKDTPETQDVPVIILSIVDDKRLGFTLGATEYIVKPVGKEVLLKKLRNFEKRGKIKRVLVVDNEPETVRLIGHVLKEAEYQVATAYNSEDAIKCVEDFRPDLVVLNLTMPEVSGFDVIEYLKTGEDVKDIPLIVLTHKDLTEKEIDDLNHRIQAILNKAVLTKEDLLKELKDTISKVSQVQ